jgi:hypothetical protein
MNVSLLYDGWMDGINFYIASSTFPKCNAMQANLKCVLDVAGCISLKSVNIWEARSK